MQQVWWKVYETWIISNDPNPYIYFEDKQVEGKAVSKIF